jgi:cytochrome c biogenesis protein CcdA
VIDLVVLVVSVACVDSLNPGTIVPALYLATGRRAVGAVFGFAAGFLVLNVVAGSIALVLGHRLAIQVPRPSQSHLHVAEVVLGLLAVAASTILWVRRRRIQQVVSLAEARTTRVAPLAGATIAAVEFPTALPYLAVIAALAASHEPTPALMGLVVLFNLIFLAPVVAIGVVRASAGPRTVDTLTRLRVFTARRAGDAVAVLVLGLGIVLLVLGLSGLRQAP